jgi:polyhydroxybutyrate depolymerase
LISGWHDLADRTGFLVVYPQGTSFPQRWNSSGSWGADVVDDVQFFRDMLESLPAVVDVDTSRVYVNGFSNGGGMAVRIGCQASDVVTAIGSVAGAIVDLGACQPSRPVPVMAFHGTADPVVGYRGNMPLPGLHHGADLTRAPSRFLGAEGWTAAWAQGNACDPIPVILPQQGDVSGVHYTGCSEDAKVVFYAIDEGGHTWPGGWPIPAVGKTSQDIDATQELWGFFQGYELAAP